MPLPASTIAAFNNLPSPEQEAHQFRCADDSEIIRAYMHGNPFVVQAAFKVEAGEITELDVSAERAKNLEFLRGLAFEYGAGMNFADGWGALRRGAESAK